MIGRIRWILATGAGLVSAASLLALIGGCRDAPPPALTAHSGTQRATLAARQVPPPVPPPSGKELYRLHCSPCHGSRGDGRGLAARYVYPKPRNFRSGRFRLVTRANGVAAPEDIDRVIQRGIPGSAMPSFPKLSAGDRQKLVAEVLEFGRAGIRDRVYRFLADELEESEIDEAEVRKLVDLHTAPGPAVTVPAIGPADAETVARGKQTFFELNCHACHGDEGRGDGDIYLLDDEGHPTRARDLAYDQFKGGHEPESVYLRIRLGMPGTPMPATKSLTEDQLIALVHYCRWLAREPKQQYTNYQRARRAIGDKSRRELRVES